MPEEGSLAKRLAGFGIAALCFGYFASYVPYSMMTKMVTKGLCCGLGGKGLTGFEIQPIAVLGSFVAMYAFITAMRWWKHCTHTRILGLNIPRPQWFTFLSGICTAGQIITTTLAYTFSGISIVFAMLLMRGGVLIMAPIVDMAARRRKRRIYWPSWVAAALSVAALVVAFSGKAGTAMTLVAAVDIALYLAGYFFRLFIMSNYAKSTDAEERKRYFAEEQLVANPLLLLGLFVAALYGSRTGSAEILSELWRGFAVIPWQGYFAFIFLLGVFSYGTGLFGSLIYLDCRENTFTVPANRASSIIAGVIATYLLAILYGERYPGTHELAGAGLIILAILFLAYRTIVERHARSDAAAGEKPA
ncbi:MAG: hypothetical protein JXA24_04475 [Proteobacteria bacterium]|nr:hypothetical protein [Pseudomonadota bacterium]